MKKPTEIHLSARKMAAIVAARVRGLTFRAIEARFGLRRANGMTAYRAIQRHAAMRKKTFKVVESRDARRKTG